MPPAPARTTAAPSTAARHSPAPRRPAHSPAGRSLPAADARQGDLAALAAPRTRPLPARLRAGIERLSGLSMAHVQVHHGSPEPARLGAEAFAQGRDIHLAPGQDQHLPHEAWHVVQQAQGRVRPTRQAAGGPPLNDDAGLEAEADAMGAQAMATMATPPVLRGGAAPATRTPAGSAPVQRKIARQVWDQQILPNLVPGVRIAVTQDSDQTEKLVGMPPKATAPVVKIGTARPVPLGDTAAFIDAHTWNHAFTRVLAPDDHETVSMAPTVTPTGVIEGGEGEVPMHVEEPVGDSHAFIHHSFSTYSTGKNAKSPRARREGGHHLTVENTHLLALLTLQETGSMQSVHKSELDKKIVNDKLRTRHLSDLDNLNFFPDKARQTSTSLRQGLSGLETKRLPQRTDDPIGEDVDTRITMQDYVRYVARSMQAIPDVPPLYGAKMLHTLRTMGEATGLDPSQLYLKADKNDQRHLLRAVLVIAGRGLNEGLKLEASTLEVFARYTSDVPELPYQSPKTQRTEWVRMGGITDIPDLNYNVLEKQLVTAHYPKVVQALKAYIGG